MEAAVRTAQSVFWRLGYEATSLAALAEAIGVHKPSLYAAYGDKRAIFLQAYDAYQRDAAGLVESAFGKPRLRDAMTAFFVSDLDLFTAEAGAGCFMLATALPLAGTDPEIADRVRAALAGLRSAVVERLTQAQRKGEVAVQMEIETAADLVLSTHIALANRARSGEPRAALHKSAQRIIDLICSE
ncbi:helix-turn-helix domain-containing protein [Sphingomonas sp.]|uniref:TetR/AcrR family transcriptional regulator n=1 Tax=Sphingomonas sp. TaxID=28214 RepID=UPI002ED97581